MRWVLILLIALNLFLYIQSSQRSPAPDESVQRVSDGSIRLLSELRGSGYSESPSQKAEEAICGVMGRFDEATAANALSQRLEELGVSSRLEPIDAEAGVDYWVYLPPLVSRQAALRELRDLQARNLDSYIITAGDLANGISLGVFSRSESASEHRQRLADAGYDVIVRALPRTQRSYWLALDGPAWRKLSSSMLEQLSRDFPAVQMQQKRCDGIATSR